MRVLYAITSYPPSIGGAQIHLHRLAATLGDAGHGVSVVTHWSAGLRRDWIRGTTVLSGPARQYVLDGVPVSQIGFPAATRLAMLPSALTYYMRMGPAIDRIARLMSPAFESLAGTPDVVHASRMGREFISRTAYDLARRRGVPFVLTPNHHPRWKGYLYREFDKLYRDADALIALTAEERRVLIEEKGAAPERVHVTGIGPVLAPDWSVEDFRHRHRLDGPFVLYLGQQYRYKGVGAVVEAARHVLQRHRDVRFVVIGPHTDYSRKLFDGLDDSRIVNLGPLPLADKTAALAACECLCVPSEQESFGGVYVEAWALGKAVIAGKIPSIASLVEDGVDGLLSSQDPGELADAIGSLLDDPARAAAMGCAGRDKVERLYTWNRIAERTLDIYRGLLASPAAGNPRRNVR